MHAPPLRLFVTHINGDVLLTHPPQTNISFWFIVTQNGMGQQGHHEPTQTHGEPSLLRRIPKRHCYTEEAPPYGS